jgi:hypothetical protein
VKVVDPQLPVHKTKTFIRQSLVRLPRVELPNADEHDCRSLDRVIGTFGTAPMIDNLPNDQNRTRDIVARVRHALVSFKNRGSVEHYHHFIFGFLVPFFVHLEKFADPSGSGRIYARSCGPFDALLREMSIPGLNILNPTLHMWADRLLRHGPARMLPVRAFRFSAFDRPKAFDRQLFQCASQEIQARLSRKIDTENVASALDRMEGPLVVLIDRGPPDPFFLSRNAEISGSGATRRSIPNMHELANQLLRLPINLRVERLEGRSLSFQIALFRRADVVVAQHGAALANMLWATPATGFVEIFPQPEKPPRQSSFAELARCLGLRYESISQAGNHAAVDSVMVDSAVRKLLHI